MLFQSSSAYSTSCATPFALKIAKALGGANAPSLADYREITSTIDHLMESKYTVWGRIGAPNETERKSVVDGLDLLARSIQKLSSEGKHRLIFKYARRPKPEERIHAELDLF